MTTLAPSRVSKEPTPTFVSATAMLIPPRGTLASCQALHGNKGKKKNGLSVKTLQKSEECNG